MRRLREQAGLSQEGLGRLVNYSGDQIAAVEKARRWPKSDLVNGLDAALGAEGMLARLLPLLEAERMSSTSVPFDDAEDVREVTRLRSEITDVVTGEAMSAASLENWERIVTQHGRATRYKDERVLLRDLLLDFMELRRLLKRPRSASTIRALTRTVAQLAGLMSLTLIKQGQSGAAKNWVRTARLAADEADEPLARSWVRAQDAYIDYYRGDVLGAIASAQAAQAVQGAQSSVGAVLGAALEARAQAALARPAATWDALTRAEDLLSRLPPDSIAPSAFGYNEAQLRFHTGSALARLGDVTRAMAAQERALVLYPEDDYLDRALVRLDQARCIATSGDPSAALTHATEVLVELTIEQRQGLVAGYAHQLLIGDVFTERAPAAAREFRDLLPLDLGQRE